MSASACVAWIEDANLSRILSAAVSAALCHALAAETGRQFTNYIRINDWSLNVTET